MHRLSLIVAAALLLAGCDKATTLHAGLEEQQANLVMAALLDAGITCSKEAGEEGIAAAEVDRAKVQLEELRRSYVAQYAGAAQSTLESENAALRRNIKGLDDQLERLKADNAVLNSTLLKMQQTSAAR